MRRRNARSAVCAERSDSKRTAGMAEEKSRATPTTRTKKTAIATRTATRTIRRKTCSRGAHRCARESLAHIDGVGNCRGRPTGDLVLVPIGVGLERAFGRHPDICRLLVGELGQLDADLVEVQTRHLLVEL